MNANTFPVIEAQNYLNRQAENFSDEASYEFLRIEEMIDENSAVLAFRVIVDEKVTKIVRVEFIIENGNVRAN